VDARRERFIERMGLMTEADGLPRIAGRIFGYLLLTPGECSLEEIASALGVSRASVSNDARRLVQMGLLERRSRPGDRRDYYSMSTDAFRHSIEARIDSMRRFHGLIDEARGLAGEEDEVQQRLAAWDDAHRLLLSAFEGILADLDAQAGTAPGGQARSR
jgi:DNA-binding transcriptional regulator GbsR (MarR family)